MNIEFTVVYFLSFILSLSVIFVMLMKRKKALGEYIFSVKKPFDNMTVCIGFIVILSWVAIFIMLLTNRLSFGDEENNFLLFLILGIATALIFSSTFSSLIFKSNIYKNGVSACGSLIKYEDINVCNLVKKTNKTGERYIVKFLDEKKNQRGMIFLDAEELKAVKEILRKNKISIKK